MNSIELLFDYYEDINESVYISDVDTYELVYLNKYLRDKPGYTSADFFLGKKCYEILYHADHPCEFCNKKEDLKRDKLVQYLREEPGLKRRYLTRDKLVVCEGRQYKVSVTTETDAAGYKKAELNCIRQERILNECLRLFFSESDPDNAFQSLLSYITCTFQGDRGYIFEANEEKQYVNNTYEWCAEKVLPQIHLLKQVPYSDIDYWITAFQNKEPIILENLEKIKYLYPHTYSILKPQAIHTLVVAPIQENGHLKGFIGIDNPNLDNIVLLEQILRQLGIYMNIQLGRRDLYLRFDRMSYRDSLTGAYNQNAMLSSKLLTGPKETFGAVYCDLNGLKRINDLQGHDAGNQLIRDGYELLRNCLRTEWLYRVGGDEFVALYQNVPRDFIERDVNTLRLESGRSRCSMSVGMAWSDQQPLDENSVLKYADADMYREKNLYYSVYSSTEPALREQARHDRRAPQLTSEDLLERFMHNTYCDVAFLLHAIIRNNLTSHFFFGDIQQDVYYISDNLRELFGFSSNIVPHLLTKWESLIVDKNSLNQFQENIQEILHDPTKHHDMRYQVRDRNGQNRWIQCYAEVKWREDGKKPLFFAGRLTQQDASFVVDSLTNLPNKLVLQKRLYTAMQKYKRIPIIAFSFNTVSSLNSRFGRDYTDAMIANICRKLSGLFEEGSLFRISGMRFAVLVSDKEETVIRKLATQIEKVICAEFKKVGNLSKDPCSIALLYYPVEDIKPNDFNDYLITYLKSLQKGEDVSSDMDPVVALRKIHKLKQCAGQIQEDVRNNMENFRIVIQPVMDAKTGAIKAGEVLLRWRYNGDDICPAEFIPILEEKGLIQAVGRWVLSQACFACSRIITLLPDVYLTVNVSLQQLDDKGLVAHIQECLRKNNLDGHHLVLELTESTMDSQPEQLGRFIRSCTDLNIRIALDDFGTGFSSMRVLMQYPTSIVKLDRSLLLEMQNTSRRNIDFIRSIVDACHHVEKIVCIEGVETQTHVCLAQQTNCDLIQGYFFHKPMELSDVYRNVSLMDDTPGDAFSQPKEVIE